MTTSLIGGHNLGLLDSSTTLLNRNDRTAHNSYPPGPEAACIRLWSCLRCASRTCRGRLSCIELNDLA